MSLRYNPFHCIRKESDILKLVTALMENTQDNEKKGGDPFWEKAEVLLYQALIGYIYYERPKEEQNMNTLVGFINSMKVSESDENYKNAVDVMFEELEFGNPEKGKEPQPNHFAVRQYRKFSIGAGKTLKSILVMAGARLSTFDIQEVRELMSDDELELDMIGDEKTALLVVVSDTDDSLNFIPAIMYSQLFNILCDRADLVHNGRLPVHVRFLLDEFANIGLIPNFEKLIATIRSREISASIILQAQSQLKAIYKDNMDTIIDNCDTTLFLGGKEKTTLKEISDILGKETIDMYNTRESRGQSASYSMNYQKLGKSLMSEDEISVMDGSKCILQVRGVRPFLSTKYDIEKHPNYKYLYDADPTKEFNIAEFVKVFKESRAKLLEGLSKKNTQHTVIEINEDESAETTVPKSSNSEVKPTEQPPPASAELMDTVVKQAAQQNEAEESAPTNQNDNQSDNYDDEDDSNDFDPDDTELY